MLKVHGNPLYEKCWKLMDDQRHRAIVWPHSDFFSLNRKSLSLCPSWDMFCIERKIYLSCQKFPQNYCKTEHICLSVIWLVLNNLDHNRKHICMYLHQYQELPILLIWVKAKKTQESTQCILPQEPSNDMCQSLLSSLQTVLALLLHQNLQLSLPTTSNPIFSLSFGPPANCRSVTPMTGWSFLMFWKYCHSTSFSSIRRLAAFRSRWMMLFWWR